MTVHAIIEKDGKLLLEKRAPHLLEGGKWSLPSGFLDRDETAEQGILREVLEETGWTAKVTAVFSIKTDPNRPHEDRQNIAFFFLVETIEKTGTVDNESTEISWIPFTELPPLDTFAFDHGEAIGNYIRYKKQEFALPLFS